MTYRLQRLAGEYAVVRLPASEGWPWWATSSERFASVTRTAHETSVIVEAARVPNDVLSQRGFALYMVPGPLPFNAIGVLSALVRPLADGGVSILSVSTYDTDYMLVPERDVPNALQLWKAAGLLVD